MFDNKEVAKRIAAKFDVSGNEALRQTVENAVLEALKVKDDAIREERDRLGDNILHTFISTSNKYIDSASRLADEGHFLESSVCRMQIDLIDKLRPQVFGSVVNFGNALL